MAMRANKIAVLIWLAGAVVFVCEAWNFWEEIQSTLKYAPQMADPAKHWADVIASGVQGLLGSVMPYVAFGTMIALLDRSGRAHSEDEK